MQKVKKLTCMKVVNCPLNGEEHSWRGAIALGHHLGLNFLFSSSENCLPRIWNSNEVQNSCEWHQGTLLWKTKTSHARVCKWRGTPPSSAIWWASRGQHRAQWNSFEIKQGGQWPIIWTLCPHFGYHLISFLRAGKNSWEQMPQYLTNSSDANFSWGLCNIVNHCSH